MDEKVLAQAIVDALKDSKVISSSTTPQTQTTTRPDTSSSSTTNFGKSVDNAGKTVDTFASQIAKGSAAMSTFAGSVPVFGTFIGSIEDTREVFRNLSKVGGGLNGNLGQLRMGAADTMMSLDDFANTVGNNVDNLNLLGGGITGGVMDFRRLSRQMQEGGIDAFLNLGYTVEEANEFLIDNLALQARQRIRGTMSIEESVKSSLKLAQTMDTLSKLTGRDVKEQRARIREAMRDGATDARLRLLERQGIKGATEGFKNTMAELGALGPAAQTTFKHLTEQDVPLSEVSKNFQVMAPRTFGILQELNRVNKSGMDVAKKEELREKLTARANAMYAKEMNSTQNLTVAAMGSFSSRGRMFADNLEEIGPLINQIEGHARKLGTELGETAGYFTTFNSLMAEMNARTAQQVTGEGPGQDLLTTLNETEIAVRERFQEVNELFAENLESNVEGLKLFDDGIADIIEGFVTLETALAKAAINAIPGTVPSQTDTTVPGNRTGSQVPDGTVPPEFTNDNNTTPQDPNSNKPPEPKAMGGLVQKGDFIQVGERGPETFVAGMDGTIIPNMKYQVNRMMEEIQNVGAPVTQQAQQVMAQLASPGNSTNLERQLDNLNQTMLQLLEINKIATNNSGKQVRAIRNAGNLMTGISIR